MPVNYTATPADRLPPVGVPLDLAVKLGWNHYNGRRLLQMELIDWRRAEVDVV